MEDAAIKGTASWWISEITKAGEFRKKHGKESRWADIRGYYSNDFADEKSPQFNLLFVHAAASIPAIVFQAPGIVNTPRRPEYYGLASLFDSIDNWLVDEMEVLDVSELLALYGFLFNTVAVQVGYDFPDDLPSEATSLSLDPKSDMEFRTIPGLCARDRKTNRPWIDVLDPTRTYYAPGTKNIKNCRWIGKFCQMQTKLLESRKGIIKENLTVTNVPTEISASDGEWITDKILNEGYTSFYEIHDQETGEWMWVSTDQKFIMGPTKDPYQVKGLPFSHISFNKNPKAIWGTPDAIYIETQMLEYNEVKRDIRAQRKMAFLKAFVQKNLIKQAELEKMYANNPMCVVEVDRVGDQKIADTMMLVQPHVPQEQQEYKKDLLYEAQLLAGMGPNQAGAPAQGRRSKYEMQVVEERNLLRTGSRRNQIGKAISECFQIVNALIQENWKAPTIQKVVGVDGALYWIRATPDTFANASSQLITRVNVESMAPMTRDKKRQELADLLGILSKFQGANPMPLLQNFLSTFEWARVADVLPVMNQQPMSMGEYAGKQQQLLEQPGLGQRAANNIGGMGRVINTLPQMSGE